MQNDENGVTRQGILSVNKQNTTNKTKTKDNKETIYPKAGLMCVENHQKSLDIDRCTVLSIADRPWLVVGPS